MCKLNKIEGGTSFLIATSLILGGCTSVTVPKGARLRNPDGSLKCRTAEEFEATFDQPTDLAGIHLIHVRATDPNKSPDCNNGWYAP